VMTNGFGAMLNYKAQVPPEDRWAIASYIRTLQYSQSASINDVPADQRANIVSADRVAMPVPNMQAPNQGAASSSAPAPVVEHGQPQPNLHEGTGVPPQNQKPESQRPQSTTPKNQTAPKKGGVR